MRKLFFIEIHTYNLASIFDRLQLFVNMFFIAEICNRLSRNFLPSQGFIDKYIGPYTRVFKDEQGNKTCTIKFNLNSTQSNKINL